MELVAAIEGLSRLSEGTSAEVVSDSIYLVEPMREGLPAQWRRNGWRSVAHTRVVANRDPWERLAALAGRLRVQFRWVRAHSGDVADPWNVMADHLAKTARRVVESGSPI